MSQVLWYLQSGVGNHDRSQYKLRADIASFSLTIFFILLLSEPQEHKI